MQRGSLADLTAFVAVADQLSFRGAASQLGVTPSALSHSMRQLEERLGLRLLHRTTRSVSLTDAGSRLVERLRPAINQIGDALEDLNQRATADRPDLRDPLLNYFIQECRRRCGVNSYLCHYFSS